MSQKSTIEWTNSTWNPITGCIKVSPGCKNCYAEIFAERWRGINGHPYGQGFDLKFWPERLNLPLTWKKPQMIFVNSMSDLFHEEVPLPFIKKVIKAMGDASWHIFQVLTKRAKRLTGLSEKIEWPPNVWIGVSVETPQYLWRVDLLRKVPASIRFLSFEPLLERIGKINLKNIDWVIVGGESGVRARPIYPEWVIDIRNQCKKNGIPFFFKQWGGFNKKKAGRELEGRIWDEMPTNL